MFSAPQSLSCASVQFDKQKFQPLKGRFFPSKVTKTICIPGPQVKKNTSAR